MILYRLYSLLLILPLTTSALLTQERDAKAIDHYRNGYEMLKARSFRNAAEELKAATTIDSTYGEAFYALAQAYKILNEYTKSIAAYERAYALDIKRDAIPRQLAKLYQKEGLSSYKESKYREAIATFKKSLQFNPNNAQVRFSIGLCHDRLHNAEAAKTAYEKAIAADPTYVKVYKALGDLQRRLREYGPAAQNYKKAIATDPQYMDAYGGLALVHLTNQDYQAVIDLMNKATATNPQYANGHLFLGTALKSLGRHHEAVTPLRRAIDLDSKNAEAHYRLGEAYYGKGDYQLAVEAGFKAIDKKKNYHAAEALLGDAHFKLGQFTKAHTWYSRAFKDARFKDWCNHQIAKIKRQKN
tara:strand:+ start:1012 stop:2082 length:1071 start_codon:yes stop_codon:yes gene_type:complete